MAARVVVATVVLLGVAVGLVLVNQESPREDVTEVATGGERTRDLTPATSGPDAAPAAQRYRHHVARFFEVEVPDAWQTTYQDRVISRDPESLVSRWEDPFRSVLAITTSSPISGRLAAVCESIFDDRTAASVLSAPEMDTIQGRSTCTFAYERADGQVRVEHLFVIDGRVFLVTGGAGDREEASEIARAAVATLEPR